MESDYCLVRLLVLPQQRKNSADRVDKIATHFQIKKNIDSSYLEIAIRKIIKKKKTDNIVSAVDCDVSN